MEEGRARGADARQASCLSFSKIFVVMMYSMMVMYLPWFCECGSKGQEMKRDRKPFEEQVDCKLTDAMFRRIYRMSRRSFYQLHDVLESKLNEIFFPKGGGSLGSLEIVVVSHQDVRVVSRCFL